MGPRGPGNSFLTLLTILGPKGPNDPCSGKKFSQPKPASLELLGRTGNGPKMNPPECTNNKAERDRKKDSTTRKEKEKWEWEKRGEGGKWERNITLEEME